MQVFFGKDKILKYLYNKGFSGCGSEKIAADLGMKHSKVYTICTEMAERGHVKNIETTTVGSEFYTYYTSILPAGQYFLDNGGYRWEWIKQAVIDFPRNFWWLIAIFTFWAGKDFKCGSKKESTQQVQQVQQGEHK